VAGMVARQRGARHYHWLFDMYPELATALGEIREGTMARVFESATRRAYRRADCVVALDADMAERLKGYGLAARVIPPWVFEYLLEAIPADKARAPDPAGPVWLYSGNLGRAHEWRTLLDAQKMLEAGGGRWRLVFQGGGPSWTPAQEVAKQVGLTRCEWRPYAQQDELPESLLAADVLTVTQKPECRGLLWPSKLALVTALPRPILWVGPTDGAIARDLETLPHAGIFAPGDAAGVAKWVTETAPNLKPVARDPGAIRAAALKEWVGIVSA